MGSLDSSQASASQEDQSISLDWHVAAGEAGTAGVGTGVGVGAGGVGTTVTAGAVGAEAGVSRSRSKNSRSRRSSRARYLDSLVPRSHRTVPRTEQAEERPAVPGGEEEVSRRPEPEQPAQWNPTPTPPWRDSRDRRDSRCHINLQLALQILEGRLPALSRQSR